MKKRPIAISSMSLHLFIDYFKMTVRIMSGKDDIRITTADKLLVSLAIFSRDYSEHAK